MKWIARAQFGAVVRLAAAILAAALALSASAAVAAEFQTKAKQAILVDFDTGAVLYETAADDLMPPASMSKIMTVYMVFEKLRAGQLTLEDAMPISEKAWRMGGSKMFVEVGKTARVEDLLRGIIVQSGNDACIVVAEGLAGSEEAFAEQMTERARELGLVHSTFTNSTGWPDPNHLATARELAQLATLLIRNFPEYYHYFAEKTFTYNKIKQGNRNPLLYKNMGADGLKTGHTEGSGYGLTVSVVRGERRLILVLNGLESVRERGQEAEKLIAWGYREFENYALFEAGETVDQAAVWLGDSAFAPLTLEEDMIVTLPRKSRGGMKVSVVYDGPIPAPIEEGEPIATLRIEAPDVETIERPLLAGRAVERLDFIGRIGSAIGYLVWGPGGD